MSSYHLNFRKAMVWKDQAGHNRWWGWCPCKWGCYDAQWWTVMKTTTAHVKHCELREDRKVTPGYSGIIEAMESEPETKAWFGKNGVWIPLQ